MDFKQHFDNLHSFLSKYKNLWFEEVLNFYPSTLEHYPTSWINALDSMSQEQLWKFDCRQDFGKIDSSELFELTTLIRNLTSLQKKTTGHNSSPLAPLPKWAYHRVNKKKRHEINQITNFIPPLKKRLKFDNIVDIGGGVGHLARTMAHYYSLDVISIDQNLELQKSGKQRLVKYPTPQTAKKVTFINQTFGENIKNLEGIFTKKSLTIGLHTCGPLANSHLKFGNHYQVAGIINFGCCYSKLCPTADINISKYAQVRPMAFSEHSLTLATRGHGEITLKEYQLKERVKQFRYAFHLLHYYKLNLHEFISIGESSKENYWGKFSDFALAKLATAQITHHLAASDIDLFFNDIKIQKLIRKMFLSNLIRWQFGRVIEHYILTDRCLFLEESNYKVSMAEYFHEGLSPRNIGILGEHTKAKLLNTI